MYVAALVIFLCRIMSRLAIWPARRNTLVLPICHVVKPAFSKIERATANSSPGVNSFSLSGASKPNRSRNSSMGLREGYPAHEMRTASRTPPQRSWCSTLAFSKALGTLRPLGLMHRM